MKKAIILSAALAAGLLALDANAQCALDVQVVNQRSNERFEISWARVPGATSYIIDESSDASFANVSRREFTASAGINRYSIQVSRTSTVDLPVVYRVTALGVPSCVAEKQVLFEANAAFRKAMVRSVIPLVGSTPGANGSLFQTSLRLRASGPQQTGKLVFRALGVPARDSDPSIPYSFTEFGETKVWDDIVAAFGATGLGSIDIYPDVRPGTTDKRVPYADVRLFNTTSEGTFGTLEAQTQPFSFYSENREAVTSMRVTVPGPELRLNMGVRSFVGTDVVISVRRNGVLVGGRAYTQPLDILEFMAASQFTGVDLQPGDEVHLFLRGAAVPMYSLTDNKTNDPALYVPPVKIEVDVDTFFVE